MAVDPDFPTVPRCPMPWLPDVIGAAHVITSAASVIRPIANLDPDGPWVGGIARGTGITASVWAAITRVTALVRATSVIWTGPVSSSVITAIIISASACTDRHRKEKEQENRPFWFGFRSIPGGDGLRFRVINNIHFHIIVYGLDRAFTRLSLSKQSQKRASPRSDYTTPWSSMASATFTNPAMFAPTTRLPGCPYSAAVSHAFLKIVDMMWRKRESTSSRGHGRRIEF
jgi:hypothetical protein